MKLVLFFIFALFIGVCSAQIPEDTTSVQNIEKEHKNYNRFLSDSSFILKRQVKFNRFKHIAQKISESKPEKYSGDEICLKRWSDMDWLRFYVKICQETEKKPTLEEFILWYERNVLNL